MRDLQLAVLGWLHQEGNQPQFAALYEDDFDPDLRPVWGALREGTVVEDNHLLLEALAAYRLTNQRERKSAAERLLQESVNKQLLTVRGKIDKAVAQKQPRETIGLLQEELNRLTSRLNAARHSLVNLKDYLPQYIELVGKAVEDYHNAPDGELPEGGFMTGFAPYDRFTAGLQPGRVLILGGKSGAGKTTITTTMLYHALWRGYTVAFYCLEMSWQDIVPKFVQARAAITTRRLRLGNLNDKEQSAFYQATSDLMATQGNVLLSTYEGGNLFNGDDNAITMRRIRDELANEPVTPHLFVADYLNLLIKNKANERAELATLVGEAKDIAREFGTIAWLPAQFNREIQGRKKWDAYPRLSDFAGSSDPTNTADHVIAIFDPFAAKLPNANKGEDYLCVLKDRYARIPSDPHYFPIRQDRDTNLFMSD